MRTSAKLGLTALMAALLLSAAVSTASARILSISNPNIRVTWRVLEFQGSSLVTIRCRVTLEGSFHSRTISKVRNALIGAVTRVDIHNSTCTGGTAAVDRLPWHITYEGFRGTLPRISGVDILLQRFTFILSAGGQRCTYGAASDNITATAGLGASGEVNSLAPIAGRNVANFVSGDFFCPTSGRLVGSGDVTLLNSTARITITLI